MRVDLNQRDRCEIDGFFEQRMQQHLAEIDVDKRSDGQIAVDRWMNLLGRWPVVEPSKNLVPRTLQFIRQRECSSLAALPTIRGHHGFSRPT